MKEEYKDKNVEIEFLKDIVKLGNNNRKKQGLIDEYIESLKRENENDKIIKSEKENSKKK